MNTHQNDFKLHLEIGHAIQVSPSRSAIYTNTLPEVLATHLKIAFLSNFLYSDKCYKAKLVKCLKFEFDTLWPMDAILCHTSIWIVKVMQSCLTGIKPFHEPWIVHHINSEKCKKDYNHKAKITIFFNSSKHFFDLNELMSEMYQWCKLKTFVYISNLIIGSQHVYFIIHALNMLQQWICQCIKLV